MSVLVTGGTGYIGSHTVVELINAGYEVVIVDNYINSKPEVLDAIQTITGKKPRFYNLDVIDKVGLKKVFQENKIDQVIHFAGLKAVGESVSKPLEYYRNNIDSTLSLLEVMKEFSVKNLVFSSSATVYGEENDFPYVETMRLGTPTSPYGKTKLFIEMILKDVNHANPELNVAVLRYFNPIGAHPSGLIGEDPQGLPNNLMPYITRVAAGKLDTLHVFGNDYPTQDGTCERDYIHVVDLALGHLAALKKLESHPGFVVYNLGTGKGISVLELIHDFEDVNHLKLNYVIDKRRPGDLPAYWADASKAKRELNWETKLTAKDACRDSWNWEKHNSGK
ncbi:MAG: UDP-glucose 4-epimerase GalE [Bacilli bacterium]|jgi:UDP-glucose 4-epimerase|nr:UDP-glucose 4-epimerase GalE [Bacilli bacterium]